MVRTTMIMVLNTKNGSDHGGGTLTSQRVARNSIDRRIKLCKILPSKEIHSMISFQ